MQTLELNCCCYGSFLCHGAHWVACCGGQGNLASWGHPTLRLCFAVAGTSAEPRLPPGPSNGGEACVSIFGVRNGLPVGLLREGMCFKVEAQVIRAQFPGPLRRSWIHPHYIGDCHTAAQLATFQGALWRPPRRMMADQDGACCAPSLYFLVLTGYRTQRPKACMMTGQAAPVVLASTLAGRFIFRETVMTQTWSPGGDRSCRLGISWVDEVCT